MKTKVGFGFTTILFFIFLVLKLTNHIDWSWFWVISPLLIGAALWVILIVVAVIAVVLLSPR